MNRSLRILIVEDSQDDAVLMVEIFRRSGYEIHYQRVETEAAMEAALSKEAWDIVISDYAMPAFSGLAALRVLQRRALGIPFIIVSGRMGEDVAVEAMKTGADDFLTKRDRERIVIVAENAIRAAENRRELKRAEGALKDSQRLLAEVGAIGKVGGWEFNIDTKKQIWTEETYKIHEIESRREITVEEGINFYTLASRSAIEQLVRRAIDYGESFDVELEIITAKANVRSVHTIGRADLENRRVYGFFQDITERKQVEKALRESGRKMSSLVSNLPGFVYRCANDRQWTMEYISEGCRDITGYAPEDLIGNRKLAYNEVIHPDFRDLLWQAWQERLREQKSFEREYKIITAQGETRWIWERGNGVFDPDGKVICLEGFITDITERKQAEASLQASQDRFSHIVHSSPMGVYLYELMQDGRLVLIDANAAADKIIGIDHAVLIGKTIEEAFPGLVATEIPLMYKKIASEGVPAHIKQFDYDSGGIKGTFEIDAFQTGQGKIAVMFSDITERKRLEDNAKKEQAINNAIIDSIPGTFYLIDENGHYARWNSYQRDEIVGKPEDQVSSVSAIDTIHPDDRELIRSKIFSVLKDGVTEVVEGRVLLRGGPEFRWLLMTGRQMMLGERPFLVGIGIDITERKKIEAALASSQQYLASIINSVADPIFVKDREHRWVLCNNAFYAFISHSQEEIQGKSDYDFFPKSEADVFWAKDEEVFRNGGENVNEEFFTDGKGVRRTIVTKKTLYKDVDGKEYIVGIIQDVTAQKKAEEAILRHAKEMEVFYKASFGREERILELKKRVAELEKKV